jgi:hypothetical protein
MNKNVKEKISKSEQFFHENETWERMLQFYKMENSFLMNRLAKIVDQKTDKDFVALAEQFQSQFILKDEFLNELLHDSHALQLQLQKGFEKSIYIPDHKAIKKQQKLRNEIEYLEKDFIRLRNEFNKYLATIL